MPDSPVDGACLACSDKMFPLNHCSRANYIFSCLYFQFNTKLPLRVMLACWGPYVLMCVYACFENVKIVSPKLRMVREHAFSQLSTSFC